MSSNSWEGSMVFLSIYSLHQCGFPKTGCAKYYKHAVKSFRLLEMDMMHVKIVTKLSVHNKPQGFSNVCLLYSVNWVKEKKSHLNLE